ncbi:TonB-dependent receptor [Maricaulis sp.]|uniref:TonB-dependent receptor plug domain-containing protein n=1 Tax=Maricaulis sp. TaxID=1486257 RepID=UPI00261C4BF7|nr:TonB-dependent receptor [Maricaulis sp.]
MRGLFLNAVASTALLTAMGAPAAAIQTEIAADCAVAISGCANVASSQVVTSNGVAIYAAGFFQTYSPVTALDMVQRVPGFSLSGGDEGRRGLADSFGNLLINGSRPSNKSISLQTVLQRIPVGDVERIELVQEALPQYDMRGHPRLVNVILREGAGNAGSYTLLARLSDANRVGPNMDLSYSTRAGDAEFTFGLEGGWSGNRVRRREKLLVDGGTRLTERRFDNDQRHFQRIVPTFTMNWEMSERSTLLFDARAEWWEWRRTQRSFIDNPDGDRIRFEQNATDNSGDMWSATATHTFELTPQLSLQTIGLISREQWDDGPEAFETFTPTAGFVGATIFEASGEYEETALRSTVSWNPNSRHSLEFGAETAINARDSAFFLFDDDGTTITPIDVPVSVTRVEETRSELFANHVWSVSDRLSLETGLRYEFSEIEQTGDAEQSRSFTYAKPSVTLNWRHDDENRFRLSARRDVAQLSFGKFASSVDLSDNNSVLGNPDYVPQRTWTVEAEWERRFGDGSFSLVVGHDWVQDLDDFIPVVSGGEVFDAPGNIGDGTNFRVTANLTTPLDRFGLRNAVLDTFLEWYNTDVEDPLTFENRPWSGFREWELRLDYRQTFPEAQIAWGWDYFWLSDGEIYRAQEFRLQGFTDGDLDLYVETTRYWGVTIRAGIDGVINNGDDRERVFYDGSRADGIIDAIEYQNASMGDTAYIRVRGTF